MNATEQPVTFRCGGETLRGVLHLPNGGAAARPPATGIVFLHGWSGCRLGPHRMFVTAARRLAAAGFAGLRFDYRGRGESDGATQAAGIATMIDDAVAAAACLREHLPGARIVILGICSGCKVALAAAPRIPDTNALVLWSAETMGWLKTGASQRRKSSAMLLSYLRKLARPETWRKLLTGRVNTALVRQAVAGNEIATADELRSETDWLNAFCRAWQGRLLFIHGSNDPDTAPSRTAYQAFCRERAFPAAFHLIDGANHSYYSLAWERQVLDLTAAWLLDADAGSSAGRAGQASS